MSTVIPEENLQFSFDENWKVLKWDDHGAFKDGLEKAQHTKAVDFFGLHIGLPWFIEVKDFRNYRIENKKRLTSGELADEVADKVRDTLAGMAWACNREPLDKGTLAGFLRPLVNRQNKVPVVLWLEEDQPLAPAEASALQAAIRQRLAWLNASVIVMNRTLAQARPVLGLTVTNLPKKPS